MNRMKFMLAMLLSAVAVMAQGPPPGPPPGGPPPGGPGGFGFGFGRGPGGPGPRATVTGAPYSGMETVQSQHTLSDGTQIARSEQVHVYRDSQGRTRSERTMAAPGGAQTHTMISIVDPVAGYETRLDVERSIAERTTLPAPRPGNPPTPPAGAPKPQVTDLGTKTINGLVATGTRTTMTIAAGTFGNSQAIQSVREVWTSPDLQVPVQVTTTDARFGTSTMQLSAVVRSEPDATLFQIPASYTVKTRARPGRGPNP